MYFESNWSCPHCNTSLNGLGADNHLRNCDKNPENIHSIDVFFGDQTFFETRMVVASTLSGALSKTNVPAGGYVKPSKK